MREAAVLACILYEERTYRLRDQLVDLKDQSVRYIKSDVDESNRSPGMAEGESWVA
jgi:hypothetical protein